MNSTTQQSCCPTTTTTDARARNFTPSSDLYPIDGGWMLLVDLPGASQDSLELEIDDRTLTVRATPTHGDHGRRFHQELHGVTFLRRFTLGEDIATDAIDAELTDGVLQVRLPLREETKPRKITVKLGG